MSFEAIKLRADAFTFTIEPKEPLNGWFSGVVSLSSPYLKNFEYAVDKFYVPFEDWQSLCDYISRHITQLSLFGNTNSPTWITSDLMLQVTCLTGEIEYNENHELEGGFSIQVMLKFGSDEDANYASIGFEGGVEIAEVLSFCKALREYVASQKQITAVA